MSKRPAKVVGLAEDSVELLCLAPCSDCVGCGGRCQLFASSGNDRLRLPAAGMQLQIGEQVNLVMPESALRRQAWLGYGLPLLGLLAGAAALQAFGNPAAALGGVLGTSLALAYSKRAVAVLPRIERACS